MSKDNFSVGGGKGIPLFTKAVHCLQIWRHNRIAAAVRSLLNITIKRTETEEDYVVYSSSGVSIVLKNSVSDNSSPTDISVKRAQITSIADDYLVCDQWDDVGEDFGGGSINVAKPRELRSQITSETEWSEAITYGTYTTNAQQRTATYNSASVIQRVFPQYKVGDEIFFAATTELVGVSDYTRVDLNVAARHWRTETEGCDDEGTPQFSFVARSPWQTTAVGTTFP